MNLTINLYMWMSAVLPILLLLVMIMVFKVSIVRAALVALIVTLITTKFVYKGNILLMWNEILKGGWSSLNIILVIWTAIFLSEVVNRAGVFEVFKGELEQVIPDRVLQIITVAWIFPSFLQGITGFGVPVAICAPLLVGLGINPISAVTMTLLGQAWGSTFGTLALAWRVMVNQTSLNSSPSLLMEAAFYAAILIWVWNFIAGTSIMFIYKGRKIQKRDGLIALLISFIHGLGQLYFVRINTELSCFIPAVISTICIFILGRFTYPKNTRKESEIKQESRLNKAFFVYYLLTVITLVVLLTKPLREFLEGVSISFSFSKTETGYHFVNEAVTNYSPIYILTHASLFLFISGLIGYLYYRKINWIKAPEIKLISKHVMKKSTPSTIAIFLFISISKLMLGSGQIHILSEGIAVALESVYVFISPFIGLLGTFITSSNLASNILFSNFQENTARALNLSIPLILATQTSGGVVGSVLSPGNIVLGATATGILGKENKVLSKLIPIALVSIVIIGLMGMVINSYIN